MCKGDTNYGDYVPSRFPESVALRYYTIAETAPNPKLYAATIPVHLGSWAERFLAWGSENLKA